MRRLPPILRSYRALDLAALLALAAAVTIVYFPKESPDSGIRALAGLDYEHIHLRRITFAQENLFGANPSLPAWYPRELLGMPFWSYAQSFPFSPTRLILLALADPVRLHTYGVMLAGVLSAWLTYLYCRRVGLCRIGATAAGWTFACSGYFASRVLAGHLPLLEAYPALPLFAWLVEVILQRSDRGPHASLALPVAGLALATACIALAGHPQLPVYALLAAALSVLARRNGRAARMVAAAMTLGIGMAAFSLWPMALLVMRSTRAMGLAPAANDIAMPYGRLIAFFLPWYHGMPRGLDDLPGAQPFTAYPTASYFWDTVCYAGLLPWIALALLIARREGRRRLARTPWIVWLTLGFASLLLALPWWHAVMRQLPGGTLLRAPARQLYVTTFVLALVLGLGLSTLARIAFAQGSLRRPRRIALLVALGAALAVHGIDLARHARAFVRPADPPGEVNPQFVENLRRAVDDGRVGIDTFYPLNINRRIDDIGFFDSMGLARPYRAMLSLNRLPHQIRYVEKFDGGDLTARALEATGVRVLMTEKPHPRFAQVARSGQLLVYDISDRAARRAAFFALARIVYLQPDQMHRNLRDASFDLSRTLMLPPAANTPSQAQHASSAAYDAAKVSYERPTSDQIIVHADVPTDGFLRVLEAYDEGWRATIDGSGAHVVPANDFALAVFVPAGTHEVRFTYHTVGARGGAIFSLLSLACLIALVARLQLARAASVAGS